MKYYITLADGTRVPAEGGGFIARNEDITAAKVLTEVDSGKIFTLKAAAGAAITLPALEKGLVFEFIVGLAFATTDWTIVSSTSVIQGGALVAGGFIPAADENTISFVSTIEEIGDRVRLVCDGVNWYVEGNAKTTVALTFTDV